jgi:acyl carrier protein
VQPWDGKFESILRKYCASAEPAASIEPDIPFRSLGIDSIAIVDIVVASEEAFNVELPVELLTTETLATPGTLWTALRTATSRVTDPRQ